MTTWSTKKLVEVIEAIESGSRPRGGAVSVGVPSFGVEHINDDGTFNIGELRYIPKDFFQNLKRGRIKKLDILIAKDGATTGKTVIVGDDFPFNKAAVNEHLFIIRGNPAMVSQKFLFYTLFGPDGKKQILKTKHGAAQGGIDQSFINSVKIPLPPLEIQKQIVERLDKIVEAQKLNDELIQKADELFQSLLHKELDPAGKNWEIKKLGEITTEIRAGFASRPNIDGVGQLRPLNIESDGTLNLREVKMVPKKKVNDNLLLKAGDVLFNNTNSVELVGKTAYIGRDYEYTFSNHMTRIRVNKYVVEPYFLSTYLMLLFWASKFRYLCTPWVNQAAVNTTALKRLEIPVPSLEEQKQIVEKLSAVQEYKKQLLTQKAKLKELFDSVLSKSFKRELDAESSKRSTELI